MGSKANIPERTTFSIPSHSRKRLPALRLEGKRTLAERCFLSQAARQCEDFLILALSQRLDSLLRQVTFTQSRLRTAVPLLQRKALRCVGLPPEQQSEQNDFHKYHIPLLPTPRFLKQSRQTIRTTVFIHLVTATAVACGGFVPGL